MPFGKGLSVGGEPEVPNAKEEEKKRWRGCNTFLFLSVWSWVSVTYNEKTHDLDLAKQRLH